MHMRDYYINGNNKDDPPSFEDFLDNFALHMAHYSEEDLE